MMKTARKLETEAQPDNVNELLPSHDKISTDEELLLMDKQRKWFLEMESTPEDAMNIFIDLSDLSKSFLK